MIDLHMLGRSLRAAQDPQPPSDGHVDANVLAAFVENSLSRRERERALTHLAVCAECRATLAAAVPSKTPKRSFLSAGRAFAAGAAALLACCAAVTALLWRPEPLPPRAAHRSLPPPASAPAVAQLRPPAAPVRHRPRKPKLLRAPEPASLAQEKPSGADLLVRGRPPGRLTIESNGFLPTDSTLDESFSAVPGRSAREARAIATAAWAPAAAASFNINSHGRLQRSADGGTTWRTLHLPGERIIRAIASDGPNVWAGSSDGALFHSFDAGSHWTPVPVSDGDAHLQDAVAGIDIRNLPRLVVTSSSGARWISLDAGAHWRQE